jgi:hypothetical protein
MKILFLGGVSTSFKIDKCSNCPFHSSEYRICNILYEIDHHNNTLKKLNEYSTCWGFIRDNCPLPDHDNFLPEKVTK